MFWTVILILTCTTDVRLQPTSCTEDSQCSSGFYCEGSGRFCRECLRCEDFKRESLVSTDGCVKSVIECGKCFKGLVHVYPEGLCMPHEAENTTGLLPSYAWIAIATGVVLMVVILCLLSKMKKFKIAYGTYATATDQSLQTMQRIDDVLLPPPAYHDIDNMSPALPLNQPEAPIMNKLDESPPSNVKLPSPEFRRRENSDSQYARVFNNPVYVREPQHENRSNSYVPIPAIHDDNVVSSTSAGTVSATETSWTSSGNDYSNIIAGSQHSVNDAKTSSVEGKTRIGQQVQDTNNNCSKKEDPLRRRTNGSGSGACCTSVMSGPSFVINVVENVNKATMSHAEYHT